MNPRLNQKGFKQWRSLTARSVLLGILIGGGLPVTAQAAWWQPPPPPSSGVSCTNTVKAEVVVLDQPLIFNRLGAQNVNGIIYALRRDVVDKFTGKTEAAGGTLTKGMVVLRGDKRPRPLVLRVNDGDCLEVDFQNLLSDAPNPLNPENPPGTPQPLLEVDDQVNGRFASFHPLGMQLVSSIDDDGSFVGKNHLSGGAGTLDAAQGSLLKPGERRTYKYLAEGEGGRLVHSYGAVTGGEGTGGNMGSGMFAVVNVEPKGARYYRSQVTEEELRLARTGFTAYGQPILNYEATYPNTAPWTNEGKAGLPVLNMRCDAAKHGAGCSGSKDGQIVHSNLNAIIAGPGNDGSWKGVCPGSLCPYPLEAGNKRNPTVPNRLEAFREFTVVFQDETAAAQAFPGWFNDPVLEHTLESVSDHFMINYGSGGIGAEIIANRLRVGPMHDCVDCQYEEFFLSAYTVGDVGQLVDVPANVGLEDCKPNGSGCAADESGPKATKVLYPDDPSNVHHSYTNDFVKFRNLHAGPKEHHIFHLHNHQWLFNANDDNSNYLDAQAIGPGASYTYEINFGGSGNRNKTAGDAIFHCHFYPHFAQGMWEMWRVHDTFEAGTLLDISGGASSFHPVEVGTPDGSPDFPLVDGTPASGARALPDGEIVAGTPIPAVVPLPGKPMAPMPGNVIVVDNPNTTTASALHGSMPSLTVPVGSNARVVDRTKNPGYPFWIAGIEDTVGQRPTTPPLDMLTENEATALQGLGGLFADISPAQAGGTNGGLPRHTLDGFAAGSFSTSTESRLNFEKFLHKAKPVYFPEQGTDVEQVAMAFHAQRNHASSALRLDGTSIAGNFVVNGAKPVPGAPYNEPCIDDEGDRFLANQQGDFFDAYGGLGTKGTPVFGAANPRTYKAANIQIDAVFNKVGYHFPQERIITLWEDVLPTINQERPPEPFVMRLNTFDCAKYLHANLVPHVYELDDFQVTTPTDVISQHIHLPKWDLTASDGGANGWNYEDGTLSPQHVVERIDAINAYNSDPGNTPVPTLAQPDGSGAGLTTLVAQAHSQFGAGVGNEWLGARTTIQRWFADPVVNVHGEDRGLGIIFTHDHLGPSTHQQVGLYATLLIEPAKSNWYHNETGVQLGTRHDGGPTSWQAAIVPPDANASYREFFLQYADFQHAYQPGVYVGAGPDGRANHPLAKVPDADTFRDAINPSIREETSQLFPDMTLFSPFCDEAQTVPRPCPEAISADDPGMLVVNYRNEPVGLRVYDPAATGPDGKPGSQAAGLGGDLAFALQTRTDRAISDLNTDMGGPDVPAGYKGANRLNRGLLPGDPFTPMMRGLDGDLVRVKIQSGAHEETHNASIHGVKWLQSGSSFGESPSSGWRNAQQAAISEQFTLSTPVVADLTQRTSDADYAWSVNASQDGWWSGMWGLLRSYRTIQNDLFTLPNNQRTWPLQITNHWQYQGVCPTTAKKVQYDITAVLANKALGNPGVTLVPNDPSAFMHVGGAVNANGGTLVYNPRSTALTDPATGMVVKQGPLHDPTAILYVHTRDLNSWSGKLRAGVPIEPVVLRAAAGDCIEVVLRNRLTATLPDLANLNMLPQIIRRDRDDPEGPTTFNNNLIRPSSHVGLHPQLVEYDVGSSDGVNVGINQTQTIPPGGFKVYQWYAGDLVLGPRQADRDYGSLNGSSSTLVATPVEFGGINLSPADKIKQPQKGLVGALVVEPPGATWVEDSDQRTAATVSTPYGSFRDFAVIHQKSLSHRYADGSAVENIANEGNTISEDAEDSGQMAINYGSEPLWFRFGLAPFSTFEDLREVDNVHEAYSNACCSAGGLAPGSVVGGDPATPVFTAAPGQPFRMRVLMPTGVARASVFALHGHVWQQEPYLTGSVPSQAIGDNPLATYHGHQQSLLPQSHFEVVPKHGAGGKGKIRGDYLFRDQASFGNHSGLWGILRVE